MRASLKWLFHPSPDTTTLIVVVLIAVIKVLIPDIARQAGERAV
jgi:hypothetical protein